MAEGAERELPRYKSYKEVRALKIKSVKYTGMSAIITPEEEGYAPFFVPAEYVTKHLSALQTDGYYVVYKDGYRSWSPTEAFETGYERI